MGIVEASILNPKTSERPSCRKLKLSLKFNAIKAHRNPTWALKNLHFRVPYYELLTQVLNKVGSAGSR